MSIQKKCNHSASFKAHDRMHPNKIKGQSNLTKRPCKAMHSLPKSKSPQFFDQLMFKG